jgi:hypothetical protein
MKIYIISKLLSKKFITFGIASWFLFVGKLSESNWLIVAGIYMGVETLSNVLDKYVSKTEPKPEPKQ